MPDTPRGTAGLVGELIAAGVAVSEDRDVRTARSRDYSWLSPVLSARMPDAPADAVAFPIDSEQLAVALGVASRLGVPVTVRGRGTGNYGQSVPLAAGLVLDLTRMRRVLHIDDGWADVEPGVTFAALERHARGTGQELALLPSTTNSTIGGFLGGGAGGSGSIAHGFVWDGFVGGVEVLDCADEPVSRSATGAQTAPYLHSYGTTGVIAAARVRLDPARTWTGLLASSPDFATAAAAGLALLGAGTALRLLGVTEASLADDLAERRYLVAGAASLRAVVDSEDLDPAIALLRAHGMRIDGSGVEAVDTVTALSYNHVTLRAKRFDPRVCHLQIGGAALTERTAEVRACLPGGRLHLDAMRTASGVGYGGLLISRFEGEDVLRAGTEALTGLGVHVVDPHTWRVADPEGTLAATARIMDPAGLLNPGKLER